MRKVASGRTRRNGVELDVIDATVRCLATGESFTSLGVQRICDEAGVARSAFYKNFTDKTDLLQKLVHTATDSLFDTACAWATSGEGKQEMIAAHANTVRVWREHTPILNAYFEVARRDPELARVWDDRIRTVVALMRDRIVAGQRDGRVSRAIDPQPVAEFLVYGFERRTGQHIASRPESKDAEFVRSISEIGWMLIYGTPPPEDEPAR
jgi:AcrR family transcriptional regulator